MQLTDYSWVMRLPSRKKQRTGPGPGGGKQYQARAPSSTEHDPTARVSSAKADPGATPWRSTPISRQVYMSQKPRRGVGVCPRVAFFLRACDRVCARPLRAPARGLKSCPCMFGGDGCVCVRVCDRVACGRLKARAVCHTALEEMNDVSASKRSKTTHQQSMVLIGSAALRHWAGEDTHR